MNDESNTKRLPTHEVFLVHDGEEDKSYWRKIGAAWAHQDGKGFGISLDGDIVIRERKAKETEMKDTE